MAAVALFCSPEVELRTGVEWRLAFDNKFDLNLSNRSWDMGLWFF